MINLQFKTNSLKIGSSVPSISLNYGRKLAKRPSAGSGKGNSCRLFLKKKYVHCQTEILSNHGNYIEIKRKTKTNTNKSQGNFASMRCEAQPYEKIILCKFISNMFLRRKPA